MKKVTVMACGITMMAVLTACTNVVPCQQVQARRVVVQEMSSNKDSKVGNWQCNQGSLKLKDNKAAKAAFQKAIKGIDGYQYKVIAYLGSQIVNGTNYAFLCKGTPVVPNAESEYFILNVNKNLEGKAEISGIKKLLEVNDENVDGGWSYNQGGAINKDAKSAFKKALEGFVGCDYRPIAYIGSQVTAGTNYAVFCSTKPVVPGAKRSFCIAYISVDLKGKAEFTDTVDVELSASGESEKTDEQIPNPFKEVTSLAEASAIAGFQLMVPNAPTEYPNMVIRVADQDMIEVIFTKKTADGEEEGYRIRKAPGTDDISGDYNEYSEISTKILNGNNVTLKGNKGSVSVAIWNANGYTYAIDANDHPLSLEAITEIVGKTK